MSLQDQPAAAGAAASPRGLSVWRWVGAFLLATAAITLWRWEIVDSPPYFETAMGVFREANFLVDSGFDYGRLRQETWGNDGGPYVYMTSVAPTLLALVMRSAPSPRATLIVFHVAALAAAGALMVLVYANLYRHCGRLGAGLTSVALVTTPLCHVQIDIVGLDFPMTVWALVAVWAVARERYDAAAVATLAAFFVKATGLVVAASVIAWIVLRLVAGPAVPTAAASDFYRRHLRGLLANLIAFSLAWGVHHWSGVSDRLGEIYFGESFLRNAAYLCPDVLAILVLTLVVGSGLAVHEAVRLYRVQLASAGSMHWLQRGRSVLASMLAQNPVPWFAMLVLFAALLAIVLVARVFVIRYMFLPLVMLYLLWGSILLARPSWRRMGVAVLCLVIGINLVNAHGAFFPPLPGNRRHCSTLERSREYLADHRSNIEAINEYLSRAGDTPLVAGHPFVTLLSFPRMGYVDEPPIGYALMPLVAPNMREVTDLFSDRPRSLVFFQVENPSHLFGRLTPPALEPGDEVLYRDRLESPLIVYRRQLPDPSTPEYDVWLVENLWFNAETLGRSPGTIERRIAALESAGRPDLAAHLARLMIREQPELFQPRFELARLLMDLGQFDPAAAECRTVLEQAGSEPGMAMWRAGAHYRLGEILLRTGRKNDAADEFRVALSESPQFGQAALQLAAIHLEQGQGDEAQHYVSRALEAEPRMAEAHNLQGVLYFQRGRLSAAAQCFAQAVALRPTFAEPHVNLAVILNDQGERQRAIDHLRRALDLRPDNTEARQLLHRLEAFLTSEETTGNALPAAVR